MRPVDKSPNEGFHDHPRTEHFAREVFKKVALGASKYAVFRFLGPLVRWSFVRDLLTKVRLQVFSLLTLLLVCECQDVGNRRTGVEKKRLLRLPSFGVSSTDYRPRSSNLHER